VSISTLSTVRRGFGEPVDDLQLLDDPTGPPVRDDERQRILVLRTDVHEVDVQWKPVVSPGAALGLSLVVARDADTQLPC
jgi:hypothetical protein